MLPEADINGRLEAISQLLFIEAGARAMQTSLNPFGARPEQATTFNTLTTGQLSFSPSLESSIGPDTRYRLRSDNSWTRENGATADTPSASLAEGYFGRHSLLFEHDPRPLGWRVEAERSETRYRDDIQPRLTLDLVRLSLDYTIGPELTAGVRAGRERTSLLPLDPSHNIYGVQARWQPSPLTSLSAFEEKRFFGSAWRVAFDHRNPKVAWNVLLSRTLDTAPQSVFEMAPVDNVTALLDAMLISRFPDPVERAKIVQDMIARTGLPTQTLQPITLFTQRVSIVTTRSASVALLGVRNTLTLAAFQSRAEDAVPGGTLATGAASANNVQYGASAALSHRFTPTISVNVSADWSRIHAIRAPDVSIQRAARLRVSLQATPKTVAFAGARYRNLDSNVATEGKEGAVFVGLDHTF